MVQQNDPSSDQECGFIDVNDESEPEYGVMAVDVVQINKVELLKAEGGQPRSLSIQLRSGDTGRFLCYGGHWQSRSFSE